jgi:hypothetical protein
MSNWSKRRAERQARINLMQEIEERAAIMERDSELLKESAERLAIYDFITCHKDAFKNCEQILFFLEIHDKNDNNTLVPLP